MKKCCYSIAPRIPPRPSWRLGRLEVWKLGGLNFFVVQKPGIAKKTKGLDDATEAERGLLARLRCFPESRLGASWMLFREDWKG